LPMARKSITYHANLEQAMTRTRQDVLTAAWWVNSPDFLPCSKVWGGIRFHPWGLPAFLIASRSRTRGADMKALNTQRVRAAMIAFSLSWGVNSAAVAQHVKDPPWNPDHIDHLPVEVRRDVLAMCGKPPRAGHYFATYSKNSRQINLDFEKFHCEQGRTFCNTSGCLHQVYALTAGHYHLVKSFYGSGER
jgi:hypothetical protein